MNILDDDRRAAEEGVRNASKLSNSQRLRLCVYFMEISSHFNGDGIWHKDDTPHFNESDDEKQSLQVFEEISSVIKKTTE